MNDIAWWTLLSSYFISKASIKLGKGEISKARVLIETAKAVLSRILDNIDLDDINEVMAELENIFKDWDEVM